MKCFTMCSAFHMFPSEVIGFQHIVLMKALLSHSFPHFSVFFQWMRRSWMREQSWVWLPSALSSGYEEPECVCACSKPFFASCFTVCILTKIKPLKVTDLTHLWCVTSHMSGRCQNITTQFYRFQQGLLSLRNDTVISKTNITSPLDGLLII